MNSNMKKLYDSGNWMIRTDNEGISYNGFRWSAIGEWIEAPDWHERPECNGGLFGQSSIAHGFCKAGSRIVLCETYGPQIIVDGEKVKVRRAKIVAVWPDIPVDFFKFCSLDGRRLRRSRRAARRRVS
jgi:hypothetical protein